MRYIDIHSHLNLSQFDADRETVITRMDEAGISTITVGVDLKTSKEAVALAEAHAHLYATIGLHPADNRNEQFDQGEYAKLAVHPKVVAIGECGLDYYRLSGLDEFAEKERQKKEFEAQIIFAKEHNLPLMLHGRPSKGTMDAYEDMLALLNSHKDQNLRGNVHFFVGSPEIAQGFLELDFTMSFTGVITFARNFDEVIRMLPLTHIHAETDSPFAAPIPFRGNRAEPLHVIEVIKKIVEIRGVEQETVEAALLQNAGVLFSKIA